MELLVLGTANAGKARELRSLLEASPLTIKTLADFDDAESIDETGQTFAENARLKAVEQARHLHQWVLADDTGLAVDALGGAPGVHSARFAGEDGNAKANRRRLLAELTDVPLPERTARFVCHLTLADPTGEIRAETTGQCQGRITTAERGGEGFGYDALFEVIEYRRTFAEIGPAAKSCLSHRGRAMKRMAAIIRRLAS